MERFACIHGHFYQPPRENPWTGEIERQSSAGADHDWNCRIARECYIPNGAARVLDEKGRLVDLVNNYSYLSFDFGPTLLSWYEKAHPEEYRRLIEADRESAARLDGHGNAIAHAYNHMILPLASPRDLVTQIRWGLEDFKHRFGRDAEALWLPETGCSAKVLCCLIDHGLKYVILAPGQAEKVRPLIKGVAGQDAVIDPRRPYRWFDRRDPARSIDVFLYEGSLSHAVAFEGLMNESGGAADRLEKAFDPIQAGPQLVSAATDGESYGHHQHFAEMGLAHLLDYELPKRGIEPVNYGCYLDRNPPTHEVILKEGPTAWSCAHGVARWTDDCGCGAEGRHQRWRRPLREALDWLSARLAEVFEREGRALLKDVWRARDAYISVLLDGGEESVSAFMREHAVSADAAEVLRLMEMQKFSMFMFTSCGWFFSEISGLEAVQNLRYAARAIELSREDLEPEFLDRLSAAPSNLPEYGDGRGVYEKLVRPARVSAETLAARRVLAAEIEQKTAALEPELEGPLSLAEKAAALGMDIPERVRVCAESALASRLAHLARDGDTHEADALILRARLAGLAWTSVEAEEAWERRFLIGIERGELKELASLAVFLENSGFKAWKGSGQIRLFLTLRARKIGPLPDELARLLDIAVESGEPVQA